MLCICEMFSDSYISEDICCLFEIKWNEKSHANHKSGKSGAMPRDGQTEVVMFCHESVMTAFVLRRQLLVDVWRQRCHPTSFHLHHHLDRQVHVPSGNSVSEAYPHERGIWDVNQASDAHVGIKPGIKRVLPTRAWKVYIRPVLRYISYFQINFFPWQDRRLDFLPRICMYASILISQSLRRNIRVGLSAR